jgi:hypothetical protein
MEWLTVCANLYKEATASEAGMSGRRTSGRSPDQLRESDLKSEIGVCDRRSRTTHDPNRSLEGFLPMLRCDVGEGHYARKIIVGLFVGNRKNQNNILIVHYNF